MRYKASLREAVRDVIAHAKRCEEGYIISEAVMKQIQYAADIWDFGAVEAENRMTQREDEGFGPKGY